MGRRRLCLGSVGDERGVRREGMDLGIVVGVDVVTVDLRKLRVGLEIERYREAIGWRGRWRFWATLGFRVLKVVAKTSPKGFLLEGK
ncbi:hypothetical protein U1Q18_042131, partial [Sarracenia purpurea var. burkii]